MTKQRCGWCLGDSLYEAYHDTEWGVPVHDDQKLFEFLLLESFQAGLSWITILRKRENFRIAFDNFDVHLISKYTEQKQELLLQDAGIIRHKLKIRAAIRNAKAFIEIQKEYGSFDSYVWSFVDGKTIHNLWKSYKDCPSHTPLSNQISKDLKKRGFTFVGPSIVYAFMQAIGMVNDHEVDCFRYKKILAFDTYKND